MSVRAVIPSSASNFAQLRKKLKEIVPYNQPGFSIDRPMMSIVYLAGAVCGLFATNLDSRAFQSKTTRTFMYFAAMSNATRCVPT